MLTISHLYTKDKIPFHNVLSTRCSPLISHEGYAPRISPTLSSPELELRSPATINCIYSLKQIALFQGFSGLIVSDSFIVTLRLLLKEIKTNQLKQTFLSGSIFGGNSQWNMYVLLIFYHKVYIRKTTLKYQSAHNSSLLQVAENHDGTSTQT